MRTRAEFEAALEDAEVELRAASHELDVAESELTKANANQNLSTRVPVPRGADIAENGCAPGLQARHPEIYLPPDADAERRCAFGPEYL